MGLGFQTCGETALHRGGTRGIAPNWGRQRSRQQGRFMRTELTCALMEIALSRGFDPVYPVAPFGDVEINLQRARFRPSLAQHERHADLDALADRGTARP